MLADARKLAAFASSVRRHVRARPDPEAGRAVLRRDLETREARFLDVLDRAVLRRPGSPYHALLRHAGVERGDVEALVADLGLEGALARLRDAGVHVTPEELKRRVPLVRGSLRLDVSTVDFENPLAPLGARGLSGASSGRPSVSVLSFDDLAEDACYVRLWVEGAGLEGRPFLLWRSVPPSRSGLRGALRSLHTGLRLVHWWSPIPVGVLRRAPADSVALRVAWGIARAHGAAIPWPRHVPLDRADLVADAAARLVAARTPPVLDGTAGAVVRACNAAAERGLDLTGVVSRTGGEPLTLEKRAAIEAVGATASCHYASHEAGRIGFACADPSATDDVHLAEGRVALVEGERDGAGRRLLLTSISPTTPRLLLNADIGDTGVVERRRCGCPAGAVGLDVHVHTIRAAAKVTTDGTSILHAELLDLVERVLPGRFGGGPADYQLVEAEERGVPRLRVVVSPRVGPVDDAEVVRTVLGVVGEGPAWRGMTAGVWRDGSTLQVVRREPFATHAGKVHAFHAER